MTPSTPHHYRPTIAQDDEYADDFSMMMYRYTLVVSYSIQQYMSSHCTELSRFETAHHCYQPVLYFWYSIVDYTVWIWDEAWWIYLVQYSTVKLKNVWNSFRWIFSLSISNVNTVWTMYWWNIPLELHQLSIWSFYHSYSMRCSTANSFTQRMKIVKNFNDSLWNWNANEY